MIHKGSNMNCCQPFWLTQMRVVAGVTEEGEYQGVEGDRAVLGDLDLREGELTLIIRAKLPKTQLHSAGK